jgi:transposase
MSLPKLDRQSQLFSTAALTGQVFGADDRFRLFAEKIYPLLVQAREKMEPAYCQHNGRPGMEPVVLLGVSVLQYLEGLPDRQAVEQLRYHVGWNLALNRTVGQEGFHPTTLVYFRQRLIENDLSDVIFSTILQALVKAGLVERSGPQRLDSTQMLGLVARMSRIENVRETLRLALRELAEPSLAKPPWWSALWERYVCHKLDYRSSAQQLKERMLQAAVDGLELLSWVNGLGQPAVAAGPQVTLLARILAENFTWTEGAAPVEREAQPPGAVHNPHDPQAQWAAKGQGKHRKEHVGYKIQVAESVSVQPLAKNEPTRSFLTAVVTQPATASDKAGAQLVEQQQAQNGLDKPAELYVDAAYVSTEKLLEAQGQGRQIIGPVPRGMVKDGRLGVDAFDVNIEQRQVRCPAGQLSNRHTRITNQTTGQVTYRFEWIGLCQSCPLKAQCIAEHLEHRGLTVGEHHTVLQARRHEQQTEAFQEKARHRNAIEGTQSELVRAHGIRRARYRGLNKAQWQNFLAGAACNAKRWIKRIIWEMKTARASLEPAMMSG